MIKKDFLTTSDNKKLDKIYEEMYQQMHEVAKTGDDSKMFLVTDIYVENEDGEKFYAI